jgi:hypothetical protein
MALASMSAACIRRTGAAGASRNEHAGDSGAVAAAGGGGGPARCWMVLRIAGLRTCVASVI